MERLVTGTVERSTEGTGRMKEKFKKERRARKRPARPPVSLSLFISFTPLLTHRQTLGRECSLVLFSNRRVLGEKLLHQQDFKLTVVHQHKSLCRFSDR